MMELEIEQAILDYTPELKSELDSRQQAYADGQVQSITASESKNRIRKLLKAEK